MTKENRCIRFFQYILDKNNDWLIVLYFIIIIKSILKHHNISNKNAKLYTHNTFQSHQMKDRKNESTNQSKWTPFVPNQSNVSMFWWAFCARTVFQLRFQISQPFKIEDDYRHCRTTMNWKSGRSRHSLTAGTNKCLFFRQSDESNNGDGQHTARVHSRFHIMWDALFGSHYKY